MPSGSKKGEHRGGRKKGTPNKATADIKAAIDAAVDFNELLKVAYRLALGGDMAALKLLLEYRFGKPSQVIEQKGGLTDAGIRELFTANVEQMDV